MRLSHVLYYPARWAIKWYFKSWLQKHRRLDRQFISAYESVVGRYPDMVTRIRFLRKIRRKNLSAADQFHSLIRQSSDYANRMGPNSGESMKLWNRKMDELKKKYDSVNVQPKKLTELMAVMIETRNHPHLRVVIQNFRRHLGSDWAISIYGTEDNQKEIEAIPNVRFHPLEASSGFRIQDYNRLLKSASFWESLKCRKTLIFQTDCLLRRKGIEEFMQYDYIGAPWPRKRLETGTRVGNGGLSLRTTQAMLEICRDLPEDDLPEDLFFSSGCKKLGFNLAPPKVAARFCVENEFHPDPLALHKPYLDLRPKEMRQLLDF